MEQPFEQKPATDTKNEMPILQLNRLNYSRINDKILETTNTKLDKYIVYATERLKTKITPGDVIEHGLKLLFERDTGFKEWLKKQP